MFFVLFDNKKASKRCLFHSMRQEVGEKQKGKRRGGGGERKKNNNQRFSESFSESMVASDVRVSS